jgi:hypothetical protein
MEATWKPWFRYKFTISKKKLVIGRWDHNLHPNSYLGGAYITLVLSWVCPFIFY